MIQSNKDNCNLFSSLFAFPRFKGNTVGCWLKGFAGVAWGLLDTILEMLSCIDDERTKLTFSLPNSAILIMPEKQQEGQELTYLLMPMTIQ